LNCFGRPPYLIRTKSYASPDDPPLKRLVIRVIEHLSDQPELKQMYLEQKEQPVPGGIATATECQAEHTILGLSNYVLQPVTVVRLGSRRSIQASWF
jgi:hypothetical protein